jgi:dihydroneopterin aldolase
VPEGRYHYYPMIEQVREWVQEAGFRLIDEAVGDEYHHFLVQKFSRVWAMWFRPGAG